MSKHSTKYQEKLMMRRNLIARCEEAKNHLERTTDITEVRVILNDISYLRNKINQGSIGGTSSFRHYFKYFQEKEQEAYAQ